MNKKTLWNNRDGGLKNNRRREGGHAPLRLSLEPSNHRSSEKRLISGESKHSRRRRRRRRPTTTTTWTRRRPVACGGKYLVSQKIHLCLSELKSIILISPRQWTASTVTTSKSATRRRIWRRRRRRLMGRGRSCPTAPCSSSDKPIRESGGPGGDGELNWDQQEVH